MERAFTNRSVEKETLQSEREFVVSVPLARTANRLESQARGASLLGYGKISSSFCPSFMT